MLLYKQTYINPIWLFPERVVNFSQIILTICDLLCNVLAFYIVFPMDFSDQCHPARRETELCS